MVCLVLQMPFLVLLTSNYYSSWPPSPSLMILVVTSSAIWSPWPSFSSFRFVAETKEAVVCNIWQPQDANGQCSTLKTSPIGVDTLEVARNVLAWCSPHEYVHDEICSHDLDDFIARIRHLRSMVRCRKIVVIASFHSNEYLKPWLASDKKGFQLSRIVISVLQQLALVLPSHHLQYSSFLTMPMDLYPSNYAMPDLGFIIHRDILITQHNIGGGEWMFSVDLDLSKYVRVSFPWTLL